MQNSPPQHTHDLHHPTCDICLEPMLAKFTSQYSTRCTHTFCVGCMANYIEAKLKDNTPHIPCPDLDCDRYLNPLLARPQIPRQVFDKWCDLLCDSLVLRLDRAYCPNRYCSALVLNECGDDVGRCDCPNCKKPFCFRCKKPWHADYRCEDNMDANEEMFFDLVETTRWKKCPMCGHCVELVFGCRRVKCRCGVDFCYKCGRRIDKCRCERSLIGMLVLLCIVISVLWPFFLVFLAIVGNLYHRNWMK